MIAAEVGKELAGMKWVGVPFAGGMAELAHIDAPSLLVSNAVMAVDHGSNTSLRKYHLEENGGSISLGRCKIWPWSLKARYAAGQGGISVSTAWPRTAKNITRRSKWVGRSCGSRASA